MVALIPFGLALSGVAPPRLFRSVAPGDARAPSSPSAVHPRGAGSRRSIADPDAQDHALCEWRDPPLFRGRLDRLDPVVCPTSAWTGSACLVPAACATRAWIDGFHERQRVETSRLPAGADAAGPRRPRR